MAKERTLAILKPDCVRKQLTGEVLDRILEAGFAIRGMKMIRMSTKQAKGFYAVHKGKPFFEDLIEFMSSGPCVVLALEKENAVTDFRTLIGETDPDDAAEGTIRNDFADSVGENIVHGSDSIENSIKETAFFFSEYELLSLR